MTDSLKVRMEALPSLRDCDANRFVYRADVLTLLDEWCKSRKQREAFERKFCINSTWRQEDVYKEKFIQDMWVGWQAVLATITGEK